jgi:hypothetical protein
LSLQIRGARGEERGVALEPILLFLELGFVLRGGLVERLRQLRIVLVLLGDVHRDDLADAAALHEHLLAAIDRLLTLLHGLATLLHGALALLDHLRARAPEDQAEGHRERERDTDEERRVLELEVAIEEVVPGAALLAAGRSGALRIAHKVPRRSVIAGARRPGAVGSGTAYDGPPLMTRAS